MNTRGTMELVIIKIGFDQVLIKHQAYANLFAVALVAIVMAPSLVRRWTRTSQPGLVPVVP